MKRIILSMSLALMVSAIGCSSDRDKLEKICSDVEAVSLMTDDCSKMGAQLAPVTSTFVATLNRMREEPDEATRRSYVDVMSRCLRGYNEIELGTCGDNEVVKSALPAKKFAVK